MQQWFEIDSTKEAWIKNRLKQMSIAKLDKFFRYASECLGHRFNRNPINPFREESRDGIVLHFNRIDASLFYRCEIKAEDKDDLMNSLAACGNEMDFFMEKAGLLYYMEPGKRKRKKLLAKWLAYDPQFSGFRKLCVKHVRLSTLPLSGCRAVREEAIDWLKGWKANERKRLLS